MYLGICQYLFRYGTAVRSFRTTVVCHVSFGLLHLKYCLKYLVLYNDLIYTLTPISIKCSYLYLNFFKH